jgi:hypothetical protein
MPVEKLCKKCGITKPASDFSVCKTVYKGVTHLYLQSGCKPCIRAHYKVNKHKYARKPRATKRLYNSDEWNDMKGAVPWRVMQNMTTIEASKVYPTCSEGHRYVGAICLLCKYASMSTSR